MSPLPPPPPPPPPGAGRPSGRPNRSSGERPSGRDRQTRQSGEPSAPNPQWRRWLPWVAAGVFLAAVVIPSLTSGQTGSELSYSEFIDRVTAGEVASIEINNMTGRITGEFTTG